MDIQSREIEIKEKLQRLVASVKDKLLLSQKLEATVIEVEEELAHHLVVQSRARVYQGVAKIAAVEAEIQSVEERIKECDERCPRLDAAIKEIEHDSVNIFDPLSEKFSAADICLYRIQHLRTGMEDVYLTAREKLDMSQEELASTDYEYQVVLASPMADERSAWIKHQTDELLSGNKVIEKSINSLG